jgi:protocatechuate 3,4-dioxygenase beta subunit
MFAPLRDFRGSRLAALLVVLLAASPALSQVASGNMTGLVKDPDGRPVPGVAVTVTDIATNRQRIVITTADGVYTAAGLPPGGYRDSRRFAAKASVWRRVRRRASISISRSVACRSR